MQPLEQALTAGREPGLRHEARPASPHGLWLAASAIAVCAAFGIFVLPFFFPPTHPALSASYGSGFNNRVATVAAGAASLATFFLAWRSRWVLPWPATMQTGHQPDQRPVQGRYLALALIACAAFMGGLGWLLTRSQLAYHDNLYFMEYMDEAASYHLHIYKDFDFLYGPVLLYFPLAVQTLLRPFHAGTETSYFVALTVMEMLGIVLLYYTLEALPLSRTVKTVTLGLLTIGTLCPLLGLNYSLVRSLLPFSTLLSITRIGIARANRPVAIAGLLFLGELLQLAVSPELGVAFAAGACFYALVCALQGSRLYLVAALAAPLAVATFLAAMGKLYLASVAQFAGGTFNLIIEPLPYILIFLAALIWLVPWMLGRLVKQGSPDATAMLSLFVVCMALAPAALGRCDPLHVFFNGADVYLLAIVAVSACAPDWRDLWLLLLGMSIVWMQAINLSLTHATLAEATRTALKRAPQQHDLKWFRNFQALESHVQGASVSTPFLVPYSVEEELKRTGIYHPDRECFYIGIWDNESETARVRRLNATEWALVPAYPMSAYETADSTRHVLGLGLRYRDRHPPWVYGRLLLNDLATHWTPVSRNPDWTLYHNNQFVQTSSGR